MPPKPYPTAKTLQCRFWMTVVPRPPIQFLSTRMTHITVPTDRPLLNCFYTLPWWILLHATFPNLFQLTEPIQSNQCEPLCWEGVPIPSTLLNVTTPPKQTTKQQTKPTFLGSSLIPQHFIITASLSKDKHHTPPLQFLYCYHCQPSLIGMQEGHNITS